MDLLPIFSTVIALGSLGLLLIAITLCVDYIVYKGAYFSGVVQHNAWQAIMFLTIASVVMSLIYSEYFGFIPCSLCWLQRIALYPQALLVILAFQQKDTQCFPRYGIGLSVFGLIVALYQYAEQMLPKQSGQESILPCLADGSNADCATRVIDMFGFVTFPFISAVVFSLLIMLYLYILRTRS